MTQKAPKKCHKTKADKNCPVTQCDDQIVGTKRKFCTKHDRAHANITQKVFPRVKKGSKEPATPEVVQEQEAYTKIFGDRNKPWDQDLGSKVLNDYVNLFPDGECQKAGKSRGSIQMSQYVNSQGTRVEKSSGSRSVKWDLEIFQIRIKQFRPWSDTRILKEWEFLKSKPEAQVDDDPAGSALRLKIPAWMIGEDYEDDKNTNFQERRVVY